MPHDLEQARDLAHSIRFSAEGVASRPVGLERPPTKIRMSRRFGLAITPEVTPGLWQVVTNVCSAFGLEADQILAQVHPSADMQALCTISEGKCLVEMTSSLVQHLDEQEQAFVIGHELGHFLLDHHYLPLPPEGSYDRYRQLRAREISADRTGLMACGSTEAAIRATIKTFSGLGEEHLRFDAAAFLRRAFQDDNKALAQAAPEDTHPSFAIRARCLVHFSALVNQSRGSDWKHEFERVDQRVERDFLTYGETQIEARTSDLETEVAQWLWIAPMAASGRITSDQLAALGRKFGQDFANSVRSSFSSMSRREVEVFVGEQLMAARTVLHRALPASASDRTSRLIAEAEQVLGLPAGSHPIKV